MYILVNCTSGVMVIELVSGAVDHGVGAGRVKPMSIKLILLIVFRAKNGLLGIREKYSD